MPAFLLRLSVIVLAAARVLLHAEEPFSFEKTPGKLPKTIIPTHYAVTIRPTMETATFTGEVAIAIDVREPVKQIVLNALHLKILRSTLDENRELPAPAVDPAVQTLTYTLEKKLAAGQHTLAIQFAGHLGEQPEGLYLTRFQKDGKDERALATQFEATDARRMFPCWDEPVFRATFQLSVTVPDGLIAISNMPVEKTAPGEAGRRLVHFEKSPKMSTYLLALCVGDFEKLSGEVDGVQLGIYTTPGKRDQGRYAMEVTKQVLHFYNEYFGMKYPLPKLDQVALPSTGASGMENWGCIIYNDSALLYDPATSSQSTKERVFEVIAHELAHQWFGDFVTMAWWDNLWLNEGFASWMGTKATDHFNPEWKVWLRAAGGKEWAMTLDARSTTHPIQQPVASESQATDAFDEITYSKGQAVLRMIESWLGEEKFRDGIRSYLKKHAYSNTTTADLWRALEDVSGKPVRAFAAGWTEQPGFPVVRVATDAEGVALQQERFTIHQKNPAPLTWQIPVAIGPAGDPLRASLVLLEDAAPQRVATGEKATPKANLGAVGYYRVQPDAANFKGLLTALPFMAEADRLNLLYDTWALAQAGRGTVTDYLDLAAALIARATPTELEQIIGVLWSIDSLERGTPNRDGFRKWARAFLRPHFDRLGWDAKPGESPLDAQLRASLIRILGAFGSEALTREARARFKTFLANPASLPGDLRGPVFTLVGREADAAMWAQLHALAKKEDSFEQKHMLYSALASARDPALAAKTLALALTDELISPDAARLVPRVAHNGEQPELAWDFTRQHLGLLLGKLPAFKANDYVPGLFRAFGEAGRAAELETFAEKNLPPSVGPSVAKAADAIRFHAEFKARALPGIDAWCAAHPPGKTEAQ